MNHYEHWYVDIDTGEILTKSIIKKYKYVKIGKSDTHMVKHSYTEKTITKWHLYRRPSHRPQEIEFSN